MMYCSSVIKHDPICVAVTLVIKVSKNNIHC